MPRCTALLVLSALLCLIRIAHADKVDAYIQAQMQQQHLPGLSLAVVYKGKLLKAQGYGLADMERKTPVTAETAYDVGSVGKQFTAAAILMLVESGKLRLEDSISRFLADAPPAWKTITIRHLLTHTSGLKDYETELPATPSEGDPLTSTDLVHRVAARPLNFRPGEKWLYSQTGYVLLGLIIQSVTGRPFGDFIQSRIFQPLGMTASHIKGTRQGADHLAVGYRWAENAHQPAERDMTAYADGFFASTAEDLAKWSAALETDTLLSKPSRELMWTPMTLNNGKSTLYGFGWYIETFQHHRILGHAGASGGYSANLTCFPDDKLTVIVLTNLRDINAFQIGRGVAGLYVPELLPGRGGSEKR